MKKYVPAVTLGIALMGAAQVLTTAFHVPVYIFPSPFIVAVALLHAHTLGYHFAITFVESISGFMLGSLIGFILGIVMAENRSFAQALLPYVVGSNAIPVVAVAPLVVLWLGHGLASKAAVAAFLCFFPLCINTYNGLGSVPTEYKELFSLYGSTRWQFLTRGKIPHSAPFLMAGLKLNATYAVIGAVVAEFIGADAGLGFGMVQSMYQLDVPTLWVFLLASILLGVGFYATIWAFEHVSGLDKRYK